MSTKTILIVLACLAVGPLGVVGKAHAAKHQKPKEKVLTISILDTQIDRDFIKSMEGSSLKGYVPLVHSTNSGVTIAHGMDIGQLSLKEFERLPIEEKLKDKLRPYVGLKKYNALNFLKKHPLKIDEIEMHELNVVIANKILQPLVFYYERASGKSFLELPPQAQTVIFSYAYQYGPGFIFRKQSADLWHSFTTENWTKASKHLKEDRTYSSRRHSEAALLASLT